jgi:class 3 adenylate cyclase
VKRFPLLLLGLLLPSLAAPLLYRHFVASVLSKSIQTAVVNDPASGLAGALNGLSGGLGQASDSVLLDALRLSQREDLKKLLAGPLPPLPAVQSLCAKESLSSPLLVVTDPFGGVLYSSRPLPLPAPSPSPTPRNPRRAGRFKSKHRILPSAKDWPGMSKALSGARVGGLLTLDDASYLVWIVPVQNRGKVLGTAVSGVKIDLNFLDVLKRGAPDPIAYYSKAATLMAGGGAPPALDYENLLQSPPGTAGPVSIVWNRSPFLAGGLPLEGLDQKPAAYLACFQPVKQNAVVAGDPRKALDREALLLEAFVLASVLLSLWLYGSGMGRLHQSLRRLAGGDFRAPIPTGSWSDWGRLGKSLKSLADGLSSKERLFLVLGKAVDPHAAEKILAEKDYFSLKGENRECALLRAELKGFPELGRHMDPAALVEALNGYFSLIQGIVFKHEGFLDKFTGNSALAVWGAPFAHPDKEARAVKAALEIQEAVRNFNLDRVRRNLSPFTLGIGIHTGTVVSGNLGSDQWADYGVWGEPLEVASRLCSMAPPGGIIVSEETKLKSPDEASFEARDPLPLPNRLDPLKTYEIRPNL